MPKFLSDGIFDGSSTDLIVDGKIGIGTASPSSKLDVAGRAVIGTGNTLTNATNAAVIGNSNNLTNDTIVDSNTNLVLGDYGAGRFANIVISDRTLRLGRADDITASSSNTTGILNFNDSVEANYAFSNAGGIVGYFPPPTSTNNYNFFNAFSENVSGSTFSTGASPTAYRMNISMDPNLNCVGYKFDSNTSVGGGVYYTVSQNNASASSRGIVTFDCRHQNQNYEAPNGHSLFEITSGYGRTKFLIKQVNGSSNVGIGTTNPSRKLQVIGTDGAAKFYYNSSFTNAQYSVVDVGMMTSGTAANGFGPKITFRMGGNGYDGYAAGTIGTIRNGADNNHNLNFGTSNSGSMTTKMTITNTGNVGIGTESPNEKLTVAGQIQVTDSGTQARLNLNNTGTGDSQINFQLNNTSKFTLGVDNSDSDKFKISGSSLLGSNDRFVIDSSGNVGIGVTTPSTVGGTAKMTINAQASPVSIVNGTADGMYIRRYGSGQYQIQTNVGGGNSGNLSLQSYGGNVGIGTTSPGAKLHVNGTSEFSERLLFNKTVNTGSLTPAFYRSHTGFSLTTDSNYQKMVCYGYNANNNPIFQVAAKGFASDVTTAWDNDAATRFTVLGGGNVGIGTTSPSNKLDVNGIIEASKLILPTAATNGAGTVTTPAGKLDVRSDSTWSNSAIVIPGTTNQNPVLAFYRPSGNAATAYPWHLEAQGSNFHIKTGVTANIGSETVSTKVTINSSGNVGIGTTSPVAKLEVEGGDHLLQVSTTSATGNPYISFNQAGTRRSFVQHSDGGDYLKLASEYGGIAFFTGTGGTETQKMTILSGGNVGIGTTSPSQKLDVVGSIEVSDGVYIGGTATANKLDDYEEGTFTPNLTVTGTSTSISSKLGRYTKIGNLVHVEIHISDNVPEDYTTQIRNCTNLPFTILNTTFTSFATGTLFNTSNKNTGRGFVYGLDNTTTITFYDNGFYTDLPGDETTEVTINITYTTS